MEKITTAITQDGSRCRVSVDTDQETTSIDFDAVEIPRLIAGLSQQAQAAREITGHPQDLLHFPTDSISANLSVDGQVVLLTLSIRGGANLTFSLPAALVQRSLGDLSELMGAASPATTATKH